MEITAGTLFVALAVLFNSLELISSAKPTLLQLFPGSDGIEFPPIEELRPEDTQIYHNFRTLDHQQMSVPNANFLKRGHVIFAFRVGYLSKSLNNLFGRRLSNKCMVFDMIKDQWVPLRKPDFDRLGPNHNIHLIRARDQAAATQTFYYRRAPHTNYQASQKIHKAASEAAYYEAGLAEYRDRKTQWGQTAEAADFVQRSYSEAYNDAYQRLAGGQ